MHAIAIAAMTLGGALLGGPPPTHRLFPSPQYPVSLYDSGSGSLALADLDGDGALDAIATDPLSVLRGSGDGEFGSSTQIESYSFGLRIIALADLDDDGAFDLVTTQRSYRGLGDGTFRVVADIGASRDVVTGALIDMDGDGRLDLVTADGDSGTVTVERGVGDGSFDLLESVTLGDGDVVAVAVGDLDDDGDADILASRREHPLGGETMLLRGEGDGTTSAPEPFASGFRAVTIGDLNLDGRLDAVVAGQQVEIFYGKPTGFRRAAIDLYAYGIVIGDVDTDGHPDLVLHQTASGFHVVRGKADGTLGRPERLPFDASRGDTVVIDVDGDDRHDLVHATQGNLITVHYGRADGMFATNMTAGRRVGCALRFVLDDVNGDALDDLVTAQASPEPAINVDLGRGDATFEPFTSIPVDHHIVDLRAADFDGDDRLDLVALAALDADPNEVIVLHGLGTGHFEPTARIPAADAIWTMDTGDMDGDGDIDVVIADGEGVAFAPNDGNGRFGSRQRVGDERGPVRVGDLNHDGALDVVTSLDREEIVYLNLGKGTFAPPVSNALPFGHQGVTPIDSVIADLDDDGHLDIATTRRQPIHIAILYGIGDGMFEPAQELQMPSERTDLEACDINGDGRLDIIATRHRSHSFIVVPGLGDRQFALPQAFFTFVMLPLNDPTPVATADLDGDGDRDVVVSHCLAYDGEAVAGGYVVLENALVTTGCAADLDGSAHVGFDDLVMLLGAWGPCSGCAADLDDDGTIGPADLEMLLGQWDDCRP